MGTNYEKVPLKIKFLYGIGAFGYLLTSAVVSVWLLRFYQDIVKLNPTYMQWGYIIYGIWNFINDPIFGYISDRTKTKWGRRRPFIIISAPMLGITFALLWMPPQVDQFWLFIYFTVVLSAYDTFYTIIGVAYLSLLPEMTIDPVERAKISAFSQVSGALASVVGYLTPFFFIKSLKSMALMGTSFGIIAAIFPFITGLTVKERMEFVMEEQPGMLEALIYSLKNKSFLIFEGFAFMFILMMYTILPSISYYTTYVLKVGPEGGILLVVTLFGAALIGFPAIIYIQKNRGTRDAMMIATAIIAIGLSLLYFAESFQEALAFAFISGLGLSAPVLLINVMIADIVDEDELRTGVRREGMYFGTNALITKPAISLGAIIVLEILKQTGFIPGSEHQPISALIGIKLLVSLIPAACLVIALVFLAFYPLHGEYLMMVKKKVEELHKKKKKKLESQEGLTLFG